MHIVLSQLAKWSPGIQLFITLFYFTFYITLHKLYNVMQNKASACKTLSILQLFKHCWIVEPSVQPKRLWGRKNINWHTMTARVDTDWLRKNCMNEWRSIGDFLEKLWLALPFLSSPVSGYCLTDKTPWFLAWVVTPISCFGDKATVLPSRIFSFPVVWFMLSIGSSSPE